MAADVIDGQRFARFESPTDILRSSDTRAAEPTWGSHRCGLKYNRLGD
jgi:hypothetical protein